MYPQLDVVLTLDDEISVGIIEVGMKGLCGYGHVDTDVK